MPVSSRTVEAGCYKEYLLQERLLAAAVAIGVQVLGLWNNRVQGEAVAMAPLRFRPLIEYRRKSTHMYNVLKRGIPIYLVVQLMGGGRLPRLQILYTFRGTEAEMLVGISKTTIR